MCRGGAGIGDARTRFNAGNALGWRASRESVPDESKPDKSVDQLLHGVIVDDGIAGEAHRRRVAALLVILKLINKRFKS
eukprot:11157404-Lingulodinium_polyedra.AAC.1